jgi:hypothetical protein
MLQRGFGFVGNFSLHAVQLYTTKYNKTIKSNSVSLYRFVPLCTQKADKKRTKRPTDFFPIAFRLNLGCCDFGGRLSTPRRELNFMEADQVLEAYVKDMGSELGTLFDALSHELTWVHWRWNQYRILFGEKPSRIELLNASAPFFFRIIQNVLFEETLLGISRLIDPSDSGEGKFNLTIQALPPLCQPKIQDQIRTMVREAANAGEFAKDWRNRHIAHRDLDLVLGRPAKILEPATRDKVEVSLSALRDVLKTVEHEYCKGKITGYFCPNPWDAELLLHVLRDGLLREKDKQECWNRGERHDDDTKPLEPI